MNKIIKAEAKNIRMTSRKVRLVADAIRHLSPRQAVDQLRFLNKAAARPLIKVINSAIANAVNNFKLKEEDLFFEEIQVGEGQTLKRWRAVSRGRGHQILKRTSHIKIKLKVQKLDVRTSQLGKVNKVESQNEPVKKKGSKVNKTVKKKRRKIGTKS